MSHLRRQPANTALTGAAERLGGSEAIGVEFRLDHRHRHSGVRFNEGWRAWNLTQDVAMKQTIPNALYFINADIWLRERGEVETRLKSVI